MFFIIVKVYIDGDIGRTLDLTQFEGYKELINELEVMFNFEGQLTDSSKGWRVSYKDEEGDVLLIGDDLWQ
ncbi:hypothetical protein SUGI_0453660 [Cryptomeria japonica]|nr:hypothetical protein SUGI_0453660 [Cryptomeria japonica]